MAVNVHFVAKANSGEELERRLRGLGFERVRTLPGAKRVLLVAEAEELSDRLGMIVESRPQETAVGPIRRESPRVVVADWSGLPPPIAELVESCHTPIPPDRLGGVRP